MFFFGFQHSNDFFQSLNVCTEKTQILNSSPNSYRYGYRSIYCCYCEFSLIMGSREVFYYLVFNGFIDSFFQFYLLKTIKWAIIIFLIYFVLASIYYITVNKEGFKFFSAGATVATIMFILLSNGFNIYIKYFSHYNALYGSIGAIIIFLIWMYLNSYVLILGFELNSAIAEAYIEGHSKRKVNSKSDRPKISKTAINMINAKRLKIILNRSWIGKLISKNNKKQESKH